MKVVFGNFYQFNFIMMWSLRQSKFIVKYIYVYQLKFKWKMTRKNCLKWVFVTFCNLKPIYFCLRTMSNKDQEMEYEWTYEFFVFDDTHLTKLYSRFKQMMFHIRKQWPAVPSNQICCTKFFNYDAFWTEKRLKYSHQIWWFAKNEHLFTHCGHWPLNIYAIYDGVFQWLTSITTEK